MDIDLFKYILRLSVIPMLFLSLLLITHGTVDGINIVNLIDIDNVDNINIKLIEEL